MMLMTIVLKFLMMVNTEPSDVDQATRSGYSSSVPAWWTVPSDALNSSAVVSQSL